MTRLTMLFRITYQIAGSPLCSSLMGSTILPQSSSTPLLLVHLHLEPYTYRFLPRTLFMTVGCFSRFWCCGQPPSPSDEAVEARVLAPTGAAQPMLPSSHADTIHLDPAKAQQHIARVRRFRILVMGRANAGKTTILQRVCNTTDRPEISNEQGQKVCTIVRGS
ncbi:hypothetical protein EDC04DRAFT_1330436 [Pisolithus marmoratus]|nr:hypothetical protein EDC04DRAFT_1330436 [Pisolithus marmoratus]